MATMPVYNMTDLWNSGGTTYDAIKMNVTDSASAAASRLMTLQVGSTDKSYITKAGLGYFAGGLLLAAASALVVGHTANLAIGGNSNSAAVFGTTAATGGVSIGMFSATAGTGPHLDFYRSKDATLATATVVASGDALGIINAFGAQQTGTFSTQSPAAQIRFEVDGTVTSGASGDMPGRIILATTADGAGTLTDRIILDSAGIFKPATNDGAALGKSGTAWADAFFASGAIIDFNAGDVTITHSANTLAFGGASQGYLFDAVTAPASNDGAPLGSTTNQWSDLFLASGGVLNFSNGNITVTHSSGILDFSSGTYRFQSSGTSTPGSGNNSSGVVIDSAGTIYSSRGGNSAVFNRTADGNLVNFNSGGANQGIISISGATTTYGAFFGSHWSQMEDGSKPFILRGTICESIDKMCAWPGEGPEERLPCFKLSDTVGSRAVYGVFAWWEIWDGDGEAPTNDAFIGSLGAFVIRVAPGVDVQRGDYIESNGDGCGRVQKDDILRASTVAKITSAVPIDTYADGSRLFPCTLHCG